METFNSSDIIISYIKGLLHEFNLPMCQAWTKGMLVYKDAFYIKENKLLRALNTGMFDEVTTDNFKVVKDNYKFGASIRNLTKNLIVDSLNYDNYTHEYLGNFLRFYRDYYGLNLMSLYNCFSNATVGKLNIIGTDGTQLFSSDKDSKVYIVNINPFNKYTIFMDSNEKVELIAGYYNHGLIDIFKNVSGSAASIRFPYDKTYAAVSSLSFNRPYVYDKLSKENLTTDVWQNIINPVAYNQRNNLKLFIKVPNNIITSSIVILEGDYSNYTRYHFEGMNQAVTNKIISRDYKKIDKTPTPGKPGQYDYDKPEYNDGDLLIKQALSARQIHDTLYIDAKLESWVALSNSEYDQSAERPYINKLGLIKLQDGRSYPFSIRLVEYLLHNSIVPNDDIDNNINRVQKNLILQKEDIGKLNKVGVYGVWNNSIKNVLTTIAKTKGLVNSRYDILGYVDKDVESAIVLEDK